MTALHITDLSVSFDATQVLRDMNLSVPAGSLTSVLGPSGCGKTTLLRAIAGFIAPDRGAVYIRRRLVAGAGVMVPPERRGVGLVPQEGALFPHLTVAGNVAFGLPRAPRRGSARVAEVLDLVGLSGFERRRPHELSGGQQQRVALARALAPHPDLVLLDEPFSALDAGLRDAVRAEVRAVLKQAGATAVLVTHDQDEALSMADSVAVMDNGRVLMHGPPQQVYTAPTDLAVARFVGRLVELEATVSGGLAHTALGDIPVEAAQPTMPQTGRRTVRDNGRRNRRQNEAAVRSTGESEPLEGAAAGGRGLLTLRPEQIVVLPAASAEGVPGTVSSTAYYGHDATLSVRVGPERGTAETTVLVRTSGEVPEARHVRLAVHGAGRFYPAD